MNCKICQTIDNKSLSIYEDDKVSVLLISNSFSEGHLKVVPLKHYNILEQVDNDLLGYMMNIAIKFSSVVFETLGAQGTNILIQNGIPAGQVFPHFSIDVIPRKNNDGLNLKWEMNKAEHESLEAMKNLFLNFLSGSPQQQESEEIKKESEEIDSSEDNYMIKHLKRIP
jgi:diadenosine tetraphosphate (Ap4A) HIT family hydrolase